MFQTFTILSAWANSAHIAQDYGLPLIQQFSDQQVKQTCLNFKIWAQLFKGASLVNDSLKFTSSDTQIFWNFLLKKCE